MTHQDRVAVSPQYSTVNIQNNSHTHTLGHDPHNNDRQRNQIRYHMRSMIIFSTTPPTWFKGHAYVAIAVMKMDGHDELSVSSKTVL